MIVLVTRRPSLVSALAAAFAAALAGAVRADSPRLLFHAPFDGSAVAAVAAGNPEPLVVNALKWGDGRLPGTKALRMRGASCLAYAAAGNLPRESGTVALWTRREWDFTTTGQPWRALFATPMPDGDRDKKRIGSGTLWFWWNGTRLRADQSDAKDRYAAFDGMPSSTNWFHLAFSWCPERVQLFVNGERRRALRDGDSPIRDAIAEAECAAHPLDRSWIDRFFVGNLAGTDVADSLISDFRIYGSALTEEQVWTVFQNGMISHRGTEAQSGDDLSSSPNCDDILRGSVPLCEPFRHEREPLPGEAPGTIAPEALELVAEWVARPEAAPPRHAGGTPLFRHLFLSRPPSEVAGSPLRGAEGGAYWEAGTNKGDRFAIPLSLPTNVPLFLVEIDVPDDRLRTEDLILQPSGGETDYAMQVGLLLGGEYPNSGTMITHSCLYWARTNGVALVAMTARDGAPAAVAALRAYAVRDAALPSCREGARKAPLVRESRSAALYYEDPAINFGFGFSTRDASKPEVFAEELSRLAATMKYTGLDTLFYPGAWYQGLIGENGYNPRNHAPHWRRILYAAFDGEGLRFIPTVNLNNIPWKPGAVSAAALTNGMLHSSPIAIHDTGKPNPGRWHNTPPNYNVLHPDVQREVERIFDVLVAEGAEHPSFGGICLHLTQHCCLWWGSEKSGYNDYAIEAFCRDRGIALPVLPQPPSGGAGSPRRGAEGAPLRGAAYAEWLRADPALWNAWLQWRCDQITAFYARLAARLAAARPDAKLYLNNFVPPDIKHPDFASDPDFARNAARRCGLDISALERAIPNLVVMQTSVPADFRWGYVDRYFRFDNPDKREDAIARIRDLDATPGFWAPLGEASHPWANIHDRYWESPIGAKGDSLSRDGFVECKWRVSTLNPGGANALRHWLAPLRHHDVLGLSKGGFLVGTYGMEARLAPFLTAFRSLPPVTLRELPQSTALVKVRGGEWHGTNYLYAVNTGDAPVDIELPFPASDVRLAPGEIRLFTSPTWRLPPEARIEGDTLVVEIPQDATPEARKAHCILPLDLSRELADGHGALVSVRVSAEGVSKPDLPWNGVKCMLHFIDAETGTARWPGAGLPRVEAFTNLLAQTRIGPLDLNGLPADNRAELILGLEGCTGRAVFDLSTLRVESEDLGIPRVNDDYIVRYPNENLKPQSGDLKAQGADLKPEGQLNAAQGHRPLRGFMLPGRPTTERDIADIAAMGATLVRFQITRNWSKVDDNQDLDEYRRWIDWRVDNLVQVLDWASQYGLKVCIDLHQPPGGKRGRGGRPYEMNMFHDARYADEFVATWRHIASRVKGHPAIYGFDLVNEPAQHGAARFSYWELQRRAAEAVREIDPDTPIIVESNLADRARTFSYLSPLAMDNVIYQAHMYEPTLFTHQGIYDNVTADNGKPLSWPGEWRGEKWDKEFIRRELQPVIDFQRRHKCRIYIGEFSAAAWAPGAENYLRDCISLFEEYGWDWTYHAFREAPVWDVEKEGETMESMRPAADTPRKRILLEGLNRGADKPCRR